MAFTSLEGLRRRIASEQGDQEILAFEGSSRLAGGRLTGEGVQGRYFCHPWAAFREKAARVR
jgi:hypothetical protein